MSEWPWLGGRVDGFGHTDLILLLANLGALWCWAYTAISVRYLLFGLSSATATMRLVWFSIIVGVIVSAVAASQSVTTDIANSHPPVVLTQIVLIRLGIAAISFGVYHWGAQIHQAAFVSLVHSTPPPAAVEPVAPPKPPEEVAP